MDAPGAAQVILQGAGDIKAGFHPSGPKGLPGPAQVFHPGQRSGPFFISLVAELSVAGLNKKLDKELCLWYELRSLNYWGSGQEITFVTSWVTTSSPVEVTAMGFPVTPSRAKFCTGY